MLKNLLKPVNRNWERLSDRSFQAKKRIYQFFDPQGTGDKKAILFIIGCQRSGTTLMTDIFERDFATRVYGEYSKLSSHNRSRKIRLKPLHLVKEEIDKAKVPLVVVKPLVETQNTLKLLSYFDNSKALWMYRDYRAVALSRLQHWGMRNGINGLRAIVQNAPHNWRSENVSEQTRQIALNHFSEEMNPYDAAALFWLARNRLFFELNLDNHPDVMMCKYEDLVTRPKKIMRDLYKFVGCEYPSDEILADVHAESKQKSQSIELCPEVDQLCRELFKKLDAVYESKAAPRSTGINE